MCSDAHIVTLRESYEGTFNNELVLNGFNSKIYDEGTQG